MPEKSEARALSLSRPWAWAIISFDKRIENRSREDGKRPTICGYRGELYLHNANSWDDSALDWMVENGCISVLDAEQARAMEREAYGPLVRSWREEARRGVPSIVRPGGIVGRCVVVGEVRREPRDYEPKPGEQIVRPDLTHEADAAVFLMPGSFSWKQAQLREQCDRWWMGGYGSVLDEVEAVPFTACRGWPGIWRLPQDVHDRVRGTP